VTTEAEARSDGSDNFDVRSLLSATVLIPGSGYLVDMFDLFMFNMVRVKSLTDLGLTAEQVTHMGMQIINAQLLGLIVGSYIWGVLGDRRGRKQVLLNSILLYSLSSLLTAFVQADWCYALLRFFTGVGLAGELGAGITLISEKFSDKRRGLGVGIFIILGFVGVLLASAAAQYLPWRTCYFIGGILGLLLLFFRFALKESALFENARAMKQNGVSFGGLKPFLMDSSRRLKYVSGILVLLPSVFIPQILWSLSPEIALSKGVSGVIPAQVLGYGYTCVIVGDLFAIMLAEKIKDRKLVISLFSVTGCVVFALFSLWHYQSALQFYVLSSCLGFAFGTWVVGATMVAEMFGTNLRATAATTIPNFCRGCVIPMNAVVILLKPSMGIVAAISAVGATIFLLSLAALFFVKDTYGREMDYAEA